MFNTYTRPFSQRTYSIFGIRFDTETFILFGKMVIFNNHKYMVHCTYCLVWCRFVGIVFISHMRMELAGAVT
jgi:hypothetical protein